MNILITDDEKMALEVLEKATRQAEPRASIFSFQKAREALLFAESSPCDIALLDIEMPGINGIELARRLKYLNPLINIIFVTSYSTYANDAFSLHASGYVMKPATKENVTLEIENLRHPVKQTTDKKIRVQAFGNFEVFTDEDPIKFQYNKTKELFAYLVDRNGAMCPNGELIGILWEDTGTVLQRSSYLKRLRSDLSAVLSKAGVSDALIKQRGSLGLAPSKIECDYYDWLGGKPYAINAYRGEYMSQYSWSERTLSEIEFHLKKES